jgi:hypothetical protein
MITFRRSGALDKAAVRQALLADCHLSAEGRLSRNRGNRYLQDRAELQDTFAGLGTSFALHDTWAVETQGIVQDRTQEHLGYGDKSIIVLRQVMLDAIRKVQRGEDPPHVIRDPGQNRVPQLVVVADVLPETKSWREFVDEQAQVNQEDVLVR